MSEFEYNVEPLCTSFSLEELQNGIQGFTEAEINAAIESYNQEKYISIRKVLKDEIGELHFISQQK